MERLITENVKGSIRMAAEVSYRLRNASSGNGKKRVRETAWNWKDKDKVIIVRIR